MAYLWSVFLCENTTIMCLIIVWNNPFDKSTRFMPSYIFKQPYLSKLLLINKLVDRIVLILSHNNITYSSWIPTGRHSKSGFYSTYSSTYHLLVQESLVAWNGVKIFHVMWRKRKWKYAKGKFDHLCAHCTMKTCVDDHF